MNREIIITEDGSPTISLPEEHVTYHSIHGAIQESNHIFIEAGLKQQLSQYPVIHIFEMGFGTGLNALLTLEQAIKLQQKIVYHTVELFPLTLEEVGKLDYQDTALLSLHQCPWEEEIVINEYFTLFKTRRSLLDYYTTQPVHLVYFDAFDPEAQPELWTEEVFKKIYDFLLPKGLVVTYSSKGSVRRIMMSVGFNVEKLPGPPGKREIIRARK
jgi:tRNA U34 5-methylaminomethyl-2-thiouridine-forming methyltransferase MnmC